MKDCAYIAGIDGDLLEKQIEALLASSFRDERPEECDGIANLLGSVLDGLRGETEIPIETYRDGTTLVRAIDGEGRTTYRAVRDGRRTGWDTTCLFDAMQEADPNLVRGAGLVWEREDFTAACAMAEIDLTDDEIGEAMEISAPSFTRWWKDDAISQGMDVVYDAVFEVNRKKEEQEKAAPDGE